MATSHYPLLLIVIVLSSCNISSEAIFINTSWECEQYLCNHKYFNEKILLDSSVVYSITINSFCFGMNKVDITIRSSTNSPAVISCGSSAYYDDIPVPKLGLAFISSLVTLQGLTFINCGAYLNTLPDDVIDIFNYSSLYYSSTHAAALLFLHCTVNMNEVVLTRSYGFAMIGINLMDSVIHNVNVSNSSASAIMYNYYNETIGCGIMLHFLSYRPHHEDLNFHKVSFEHSIFSSNSDLQNSSCANDIDLESASEMVVNAAALTILYTQNDYRANVFIDNSVFYSNLSVGEAVLILHYNCYHGVFVNINNTEFNLNVLVGNVSVILESIVASNNSLATLSSIASYTGMFTFHGINCYINGTKEKPSTFRNNFGVVIDATDTNIYLSGDISFDTNKGTSGAAIKIKDGSRLHFMNGLTAYFTNNHAELFGGAIYADVNNKQEECAFYFQSNDIKIFFNNNVATEAGNDIYAFPIYNCQFDDSNHSYTPYQAMKFYERMFHLFDHPGNGVWSFSTKPTKLLVNNTMTSNGDIYTYPGQMVSLNLSALDELNRFVYTIVRVEIAPKKSDYISHLWLSYEDKVQIVEETRFTHIHFTVHTTTLNQSLDGILILSLLEYPEVVYSEVHIHPCPPGFILDNITTGDCVCSPALYAFAKDNSILMKCSIQTQTFTRSSATVSWAGLIEIEDGINIFGISRSCPLGHCMANPAFDHFQSTGETELFDR